MDEILEKVGAVVLSAGKGTRLNSIDLPKVMLPIGDKPIVEYTVSTLKKLNLENICLVVGFRKEKIIEHFKDDVSYAFQEEQKGTAHAAYIGINSLPKKINNVLVMGGDDSAFYSTETLNKFIEEHIRGNFVLSLLTAGVDVPDKLGRIIRHQNGDVEIVEKELLTDEQKKIKEISTGTFMLNREWFEKIFPAMPPMKKLGEYGLPTALSMAREQGKSYNIVKLENSSEWFGVNTPEELEEARRRKR